MSLAVTYVPEPSVAYFRRPASSAFREAEPQLVRALTNDSYLCSTQVSLTPVTSLRSFHDVGPGLSLGSSRFCSRTRPADVGTTSSTGDFFPIYPGSLTG